MGNNNERDKVTAAVWAFWGTIIAALITAVVTLIVAGKIPFPPQAPTKAIVEKQFEVLAVDDWQETGVFISKGDTLQISVIDGEWTTWTGVNPFTDGNGIEGRKDDCTSMPNDNTGGLIGQIGDSEPFWVGNDVSFQQTQLTGNLKLSMNDCSSPPGENEGALTVHITITKP